MRDFKCDSDDCGGWVCIYHGLRPEVQEHIDQLEEEIKNLKKDAAPFQNQIDQRKTYKGPDEQR